MATSKLCSVPCWISRMERSANPAERVEHYTWTISTNTQNTSIWSLTAAVPSDSIFHALCRKQISSPTQPYEKYQTFIS